MEQQEKIEQLKYNINRFDHYYGTINFKGNFLLGFNTFVIGFFLLNGNKILSQVLLSDNLCIRVLFVVFFTLLFISSFVSSCFIVWATFPYTKGMKKKSLLLYKDIKDMDMEELESKYENLSKDIQISDLISQNKALADGLVKKFNRLKIATWLVYLTISCVFVLTLVYFLI